MAIKKSIREGFSSHSSGPVYYETKGHAVCAFDGELRLHGLWLDPDDLMDFHGNEGHKVVDIYDEGGIVGRAVLSWYRMPSGRYEFIGYIA